MSENNPGTPWKKKEIEKKKFIYFRTLRGRSGQDRYNAPKNTTGIGLYTSLHNSSACDFYVRKTWRVRRRLCLQKKKRKNEPKKLEKEERERDGRLPSTTFFIIDWEEEPKKIKCFQIVRGGEE